MSARDNYTDEEWEMLTEEEQEGILSIDEEDDEEEEEEESTQKTQEDEAAAQAKAKADAEADGKKQADAAAATTTAAEENKGQEQGKQQEQEEEQTTSRRPRGLLNEQLPADYDQRVQANEKAMDELEQQYDDGDISHAEYRKQMRALDKQARELDAIKLRAELSEESSQGAMMERWESEMTSFLSEHPEAVSTDLRRNAFDQLLRNVTAPVISAGGMPGRAHIEKAFRQLAEEFGLSKQEATTTTDTKAKKENKVPPTLGGVPAAAQTNTDDGKWAHLDRLADTDPQKYEETLLRMSEAERNEYLASA